MLKNVVNFLVRVTLGREHCSVTPTPGTGTLHPREKDNKQGLSPQGEGKNQITLVRHLVTWRGVSQSFGTPGRTKLTRFKATGGLDIDRSAQMRGPKGGGGHRTVTKGVRGEER